MRRSIPVALLAPLSLAACVGAGDATFRYRGPDGGVAPVHVEPLAGGRASWALDLVVLDGPDAMVRRTIQSRGDAPVRVDLGRLRLRAASGRELALVRVCAHPVVVATVLAESPARPAGGAAPAPASGERCLDGAAARGRVYVLSPGESVPLRADFGPVPPPSRGAPDRELTELVLVDDGILVAGRTAHVEVPLRLELPR